MKRISLLVLLLSITSCGKSISEIFNAPKTQDTAGLIASCTTRAQAVSLSENHGLAFRVINDKRKMIEFYGIDKSSLQELLPKSRITTNTVYEHKLISGEDFQASEIANTPFAGTHTPRYRNQNDSFLFQHLSQIDGFNISGNQGSGVTIAIVDTGVYYNHPDLAANIKLNTADLHGSNANNIDDDGNGFKDDYVGWDFYNNDAYPIDDNGHGTHVAGLAAGTFGGVAPKAKILPVKVLSGDGRGDLGTIAAGILYAIDMGADIINLSLGGPAAGAASSQISSLLNSVSIAQQNDSLIIAAAGNGGNDGIGDCNDQTPIYPASINSSNLIAVAAVDSQNQITSYSNFGRDTVHIAAPGGTFSNGGLSSTTIMNCNGRCERNLGQANYTFSSGTSMSTPLVSGLAALIKSENPNLSHTQIRDIILNSGTYFNELQEYIDSGKVINVNRALQ